MGKKKSSKSTRRKKQDELGFPNTVLPGWPGYRTHEGRSGYDPIDTRTEAAHTAGTMIQNLINGRVRNPIYLFLLGVLGLLLVVPFILAVFELMNGHLLPWNGWLFVFITGIAGLAILINFIKNLIQFVFR